MMCFVLQTSRGNKASGKTEVKLRQEPVWQKSELVEKGNMQSVPRVHMRWKNKFTGDGSDSDRRQKRLNQRPPYTYQFCC